MNYICSRSYIILSVIRQYVQSGCRFYVNWKRFQFCYCFVFAFQDNPDLAERILENTRRYGKIFSDAVFDMLPDYKEREVASVFQYLMMSPFCIHELLLVCS